VACKNTIINIQDCYSRCHHVDLLWLHLWEGRGAKAGQEKFGVHWAGLALSGLEQGVGPAKDRVEWKHLI
jgi:hypothetical protein